MEALGCFETLGTTRPTTQRHVAEDWDLEQHRYHNFRSHTHRNSGWNKPARLFKLQFLARNRKMPWTEGLWLEGTVPFLTTSNTFLRREGKALGAVALQEER